MRHNLFWQLFIPAAMSLMLLAACGGGGGEAALSSTPTCTWDSSNWDSGCTWGS